MSPTAAHKTTVPSPPAPTQYLATSLSNHTWSILTAVQPERVTPPHPPGITSLRLDFVICRNAPMASLADTSPVDVSSVTALTRTPIPTTSLGSTPSLMLAPCTTVHSHRRPASCLRRSLDAIKWWGNRCLHSHSRREDPCTHSHSLTLTHTHSHTLSHFQTH